MERTAGWRSSTETGARRASRRVIIGRVRGAHGLRGQLRVQPFGDSDFLLGLASVTLARSEDDPDAVRYEVEAAAPGRDDEVRMRLAGVHGREQAEALRGRLLLSDASAFEALPAGEYWGFELIGCRVETRDGGDVGTVREIWDTGAQQLLVVEDEGGRERLIPAVRELLRAIDVEGRRIAVEAVPGLLDGSQAAVAAETGSMRIDVITIFPRLFEPFAGESMLGIAVREGVVALRIHDLRDWTQDRHRTVDDTPYGGGPGMVLKPEPLVAAIEALAGPRGPGRKARVLMLSAQGRRLDQARLEELAREEHLVLVCGRYEGVDQRAIDLAVDEEVSLGDYVLSGGEVPAMAIVEGVVRLLPGALGNPESTARESFRGGGLEGPQYTRPPEFRGLAVPEVLRSGNHQAIARWRAERARELTRRRRPDLLRRDEGDES